MNTLAQLRLLQLLNPALPIGSYSYSQGLEWARQNEWVMDADSVSEWITSAMHGALLQQELPLLKRLFHAAAESDSVAFNYWAACAHAYRDTNELRREDTHRARAIVRLLKAMPDVTVDSVDDALHKSTLAALAWPAAHWGVDEQHLLTAYGFTWLDAQVTAAVKLVPLGQTAGQQLLHALSETFSHGLSVAMQVSDDDIGYSLPAQSIASMQHETQYSRLYRS